ncbi:hypothetical protein RIF29_27227 [Crotalaria pallida]|uniref:Uncharacterized protein n=1 Tax=Crotalaria pallida TaxID=3830 RepID=A0AAN9ER09_CROPI
MVIVPETSHKMAECPLTDSAVVDKSTRSDHLEGGCAYNNDSRRHFIPGAAGTTSIDLMESQKEVHKTMTGNTSSQEAAGSRAVVLIGPPLEQVQPSSFDDSPPDQGTDREMLNFSRSSLVDIMPANQSIHVSPIMEPPEEFQQQSPSAEFLSFNHDLSNLPLTKGVRLF